MPSLTQVNYKWPLEKQLCKTVPHIYFDRYVHLRVPLTVAGTHWVLTVVDPGSVVICLLDDVSILYTVT